MGLILPLLALAVPSVALSVDRVPVREQVAPAPPTLRRGAPLTALPDCRDRLFLVGREGQPPHLQRKPGAPDIEEELFIYAVDLRMKGCSVLVTNTGIRPLPAVPEGLPLFRQLPDQ